MRMAKKKKRADWDDGRTIANMNIDGMPWYRPGPDLPGSGEGMCGGSAGASSGRPGSLRGMHFRGMMIRFSED